MRIDELLPFLARKVMYIAKVWTRVKHRVMVECGIIVSYICQCYYFTEQASPMTPKSTPGSALAERSPSSSHYDVLPPLPLPQIIFRYNKLEHLSLVIQSIQCP